MVCDRCGKDIDQFAVRQENEQGVLVFHQPCFQSFLKDGKLKDLASKAPQPQENDWDPYGLSGYPGYPLT